MKKTSRDSNAFRVTLYPYTTKFSKYRMVFILVDDLLMKNYLYNFFNFLGYVGDAKAPEKLQYSSRKRPSKVIRRSLPQAEVALFRKWART